MLEEFEILLLTILAVGIVLGGGLGWYLRGLYTLCPEFQACGVETKAVCRWRHPRYGSQCPAHGR